MNEQHMRAFFAPNWVFRLYTLKRIPYPVFVVGVPAAIWAVGALVALLLGVLPLFLSNPLAYPVGLGFALAAYGWFAKVFPPLLAELFPLMIASSEQYDAIIKRWADRIANRLWVMIAFSIPLAVLSLQRIIALWNSPDAIWIGSTWVTSEQARFFQVYYIAYDTVIASFLLGSGAAGILGCAILLYDVLNLPLKLAYYRGLRLIGNFSIALAGWAFIAFVFVGLAQVLIGPELFSTDLTSSATLPTIVTSLIASAALLTAFFTPVYFAHRAIVHAKYQQLVGLEQAQHNSYREIEGITAQITAAPADRSAASQTDALYQQLDRHHTQLETTAKLIAEIEAIPEWPLTWRGAVQLIGTAVLPMLSSLAATIQSTLFPK
jgi:hypothetical protein